MDLRRRDLRGIRNNKVINVMYLKNKMFHQEQDTRYVEVMFFLITEHELYHLSGECVIMQDQNRREMNI
jgi:hypothetical protein